MISAWVALIAGAQDDLQDLNKRVGELEKKLAQAKPDDPQTLRAFWKDGFQLETADKKFTFKVGGRLQLDWGVALYDNAAQNPPLSKPASEDSISFRRARVSIGGSIFRNIIWQIELDFAGGAVAFKDTYIGYKDIPIEPEWFSPDFLVGHFKEPFGMEAISSSRYIIFNERSLLTGTFFPERNIGAMLSDAILNHRVSWQVGVFKDVPDSAELRGPGQDGRYVFDFRLTGLPWYEIEGRELIHLGAALRLAPPTGAALTSNVTIATRPESRVVTIPWSSVTLGTVDQVDVANMYGAEFAAVYGPFWLQAEYAFGIWSVNNAQDPMFWGYYVGAGFFLTGENRVYKTSNGVFDRQKVDSPLGGGGFGAVELIARYTFLDLDDGPFSGNKHKGITIGVNWYATPNVRVSVNYVFAETESFGRADIVAVRFWVDW